MIIKTMGLALAAFLVTLACAVAAQASTLTFSPVPAENIELISEGSLTFDEGGPIRVVCPVTLSGSLTAGSFAMTEGTQFGSLNRSGVGTCSGGGSSLTFLRMSESPYALTYRGFLGTLPNITAIRYRIGGVALQAIASGLTCLFTGEVEALVELRGTNAFEVGASTISNGRLRSSGGFCPESASLTGRMTLPNEFVALDPFMRFTPEGNDYRERIRESSTEITTRFENLSTTEELEITEVRPIGASCSSYNYNTGTLRAGERLAPLGRINVFARFRPIRTGYLGCDLEVLARQGGVTRRVVFVGWGRGT